MSRSWRWSLPVLALLCLLPLAPAAGTGVALADAPPTCSVFRPPPLYVHPGRPRTISLFCGGAGVPANVTVDDPEHGSLDQSSVLRYVYTPAAGYLGTDHATLHPSGSDGPWSPISLDLIVSDSLNTAPQCSSGSSGIVRDGDTRNVHILGCDDAEGDPIDFEVLTPPSHGTLGTPTLRGVDTLTEAEWPYTPDAGHTGSDSFTYHAIDDFGDASEPRTATITVHAADSNQVPSCSIPWFPGAPVWIVHGPTTFSAGCFDPDEDPLTLSVVTPPAHGTLGIVDGYTFSYTPDAGYSGQDTVVYTASDGHGGVSSPTTKTLDIGPNHAPVCFDAVAAITPRATAGGKPTKFLLPCTDDDDDQLTIVIDSPLEHGQLMQNPFEPILTYTPDVGFTGQDIATFHVADGNGGVSSAHKIRLGVGVPAPGGDDETPPTTDPAVVSPPAVAPPTATAPVDPPTARPATAAPSAAAQAARLLGATPKGLNLGLGAAARAFVTGKAVAPGAPLVVFFCAAGCTVAVDGHLALGDTAASKKLRLVHRTLRITSARPGVLKLTLTKSQRARLARVKRAAVVLTLKTTAGGLSRSVKRRFAIRH